MKIDEYQRKVETTRARHPEWRSGQTYFNVLCKLRPDLSEQLRGDLALDPFGDDANVPAFLDWVTVHWAPDRGSARVTSI